MIHRLFSEPLHAGNSVALDLSAKNLELTPSIFSDIPAFCDYINSKLEGKIGYGGYLEHRVIYSPFENFATSAADLKYSPSSSLR